MIEAAKIGDIFITVTGNRTVLTAEHFSLTKDGSILAMLVKFYRSALQVP